MTNLDRAAKNAIRFAKNRAKKRAMFVKNIPKTPDNLIDWTIKVRKIKDEEFSFKEREYLIQLYLDDNKRIMIVKPRQMEITEYAVNWLLFNLEKNPNTIGIYLTDRKSHVSIFSKIRVRSQAIDQSPILPSLVYKKGNVSLLSFKNGSHLFMYSAQQDFEAARSIPADFAVVDEIQSTNVEAVPVLEEALAKSRFGKYVYIGTGSVTGDAWWKLWHMGDQKEYDMIAKTWVAKNPGSKISSYHFSQEMAPDRSKEDIESKRKTYSPRTFANEVEGLWYGGNTKPLLEKEIRTLFDHNLGFTSPENVDHAMPVYLGVDWGGGTQAFTVVWIWQLVNETVPRFKVLYVTKIMESSTEKQADMVTELMDKYQVDQAVMDSGGGTRQVEKLSKRYGPRINKCHYRYNSEVPFDLISEEDRVNVDRTWIIETIIDLIKRPEDSSNYPNGIPRIHIPYKNPKSIDG